ncbi:MAG: hypothetical protein HY049_13485 [Acidobacteria bacterium]|nr:hypothetical protein [Acidobacteriota bacterium]
MNLTLDVRSEHVFRVIGSLKTAFELDGPAFDLEVDGRAEDGLGIEPVPVVVRKRSIPQDEVEVAAAGEGRRCERRDHDDCCEGQ